MMGYMRERDAPKAGSASSFSAGPPDKHGLARIVDADDGRDDAENSYYEEAADPGFVCLETARRRFRGQYLRRLRRRRAETGPAERDPLPSGHAAYSAHCPLSE
jgi:hypothetical protein